MNFLELENYRELYNDEKLFNLIGLAMFAPTVNKVKNAVESIYNKQQGRVFYCELDGECIGIIGVKRIDNDFEIVHFAVSEDHQKQGVGAFMISELQKIPNIRSILSETDSEGVGFYKSNGFEIKSLGDDIMGYERFACRKKV